MRGKYLTVRDRVEEESWSWSKKVRCGESDRWRIGYSEIASEVIIIWLSSQVAHHQKRGSSDQSPLKPMTQHNIPPLQ